MEIQVCPPPVFVMFWLLSLALLPVHAASEIAIIAAREVTKNPFFISLFSNEFDNFIVLKWVFTVKLENGF